MADSLRISIVISGPMYRKLKRYGRLNISQFIREAVSEKLATMDEVVSPDVDRGGWRGESK